MRRSPLGWKFAYCVRGSDMGSLFRLLLCLSLLPVLAPAQSNELATAVSAWQRGDLQGAEAQLQSILKAHPNDVPALGLLGVVLDTEKNYSAADGVYRRALVIAPRSVELLNNYGNHLLALGKSTDAAKAFSQAVAIDPRHPNSNLQLARMALSRKQPAEALAHLNLLPTEEAGSPGVVLIRLQALYLSKQDRAAEELLATLETADAERDPRLQFSTGLALAAVGQYAQAESFFGRVLEAVPGNFDALYNLGLAASRGKDYDRARDALSAALTQRPEDVDVLYGLAVVQVALNRKESAIELLAKAGHLDPKRAEVQLLLARTTTDIGFFQDSLEAWNRYLILVPKDDAARRDRGYVAAVLGDYALGISDLTAYVKNHPLDPLGHYDLGMAETLNDPKKALFEINRALNIKPEFVSAIYYRGVLKYQMGNAQGALTDLEAANRALPGNAIILDRLGQIYLAVGRSADAVSALRQAVDLTPNDSRAVFHYARALAKAGQPGEAKLMMARFHALGPDPSRRRGGLVDFLSLSPQEQTAHFRERIVKAAQEDKTNVAVQVEYIQLLLADSQFDHAAQCANQLLALNPPPGVPANIGHLFLEANQFAVAKQFLDKARESGASSLELLVDQAIATSHAVNAESGLTLLNQVPEAQRNGDYYLARAQMLDAAGQFEPAVNALNQALRAAPKRPEFYREAAFFLLKHNRTTEASSLVAQGARLLPDVSEILLLQATLLELEKKTEDAESVLKTIEDRWPEWPDSWLVHGILLETYKRYDEARQMVENAVALGAQGPEAYFYLAESTMYSSPDQLPAAQKAIERAESLAPQDPWIHAIAGRIALGRKQFDRAADELQKATELRPHFAQAYYNLAQAHKALGETEKAHSELEMVEKIHREFPNAEADTYELKNSLFQVRPSQK